MKENGIPMPLVIVYMEDSLKAADIYNIAHIDYLSVTMEKKTINTHPSVIQMYGFRPYPQLLQSKLGLLLLHTKPYNKGLSITKVQKEDHTQLPLLRRSTSSHLLIMQKKILCR